MIDAILFKTRYDTEQLRADLEAAIRSCEWLYKPELEKYIKWSAIPLHSIRGGSGAEAIHGHVCEWDAGLCAPTPILSSCPYFNEIIDSFKAEKLRVRLMRLEVNGRIGAHRDRTYGWDQPILRLHVPIITHPDIDFRLNEKRIRMEAGELWYLDTTKIHEVYNPGPLDRVHLVIDLVNGGAIREQLGQHTWLRSP